MRKRIAPLKDVRADEPDRAMAQFTEGLRRVLAAPKNRQQRMKKKRIRTT